MSDRPGRPFDSADQGRHSKVPRTDPREVEKHRFADRLAAMLVEELNQGKFDRLVLVVPPRALGQLRDELSKPLRAKVSAELAKDLTHLPARELQEHLSTVIAV
jgi:protein required for attachment to host cells